MSEFLGSDFRRILSQSQQEASSRNHQLLDCEHFLVAVLDMPASSGFMFLVNQHVDLQRLRNEIDQRLRCFPVVRYAPKSMCMSLAMWWVMRNCPSVAQQMNRVQADSSDAVILIAYLFRLFEIETQLDSINLSIIRHELLFDSHMPDPGRTYLPETDTASILAQLRNPESPDHDYAFIWLLLKHCHDSEFFKSIINNSYPSVVQVKALTHVAAISPKDESLVAFLEKCAYSPDYLVSSSAVYLLEELGQLAIPTMLRLKDHPDETIKEVVRSYIEEIVGS